MMIREADIARETNVDKTGLALSVTDSGDVNSLAQYLIFETSNNFRREDTKAPLELRIKKLAREIADRKKAVVLIRDGDKIIGSTTVSDLLPDSKEAWADGTLVDPSYRGRGIGLQLALAQEKIARSAGRESIATIVAVDNMPSIALRLKAGYILNGINRWKSETGYKFRKDLTASSGEAAVNWVDKVLTGGIGIIEKIDQQNTQKEILVPADDPDVVNKIIAKGYRGVYLLMPENFRNEKEQPINKNCIVFVKD